MTHIFVDRFLRKEHQVRIVTVEKNTKKSVKETILALEEMFSNRDERLIVKVDATVLTDNDKIAQLASFSLYHYRNFSGMHMHVTEIQLNSSLFSTNFDNEDYRRYVTLRGRGGTWEDYTKAENVDWVAVNACVNHDLNKKLDKLAEVTARYQEIASHTKEDQVEFQTKRKWNFSRSASSLGSLYARCFDEVARILHPGLQYNPSPSFQRELVWSLEKKQSFIESILNEIPIGSFYVNMGEVYDPYNELGEGFGGLVWDGKQRLHALHSFICGEFDVEFNGKRVDYFDNPLYFYRRFENCGINVFESNFDELKDIIHAYVIINQSQVKHTDADLQKAIDYLHSKTKGE